MIRISGDFSPGSAATAPFPRRCLSSSFSLREGDGKFRSYQDELAALFQKFARQGVLEIPNETVAYLGSV